MPVLRPLPDMRIFMRRRHRGYGHDRPTTLSGVTFMKGHLLAATAAALASVLALPAVGASELQVIAGGAMTAPLKELGPQFESASGHKLVFRFGTTPELIKLATSGGPFDLGVVPREVMRDAGARAQFASGPTIDIARVGLGVAVRSGAAAT